MVTGFGGANADIHVKLNNVAVLSDSNPASFSTSPGGVMRNILENLSRLGIKTSLITAVGKDAAGMTLLSSCKESGIDTSFVYESDKLSTCGYIDFLNPDGNMFVAANDMKLIEQFPLSHLDSSKELIEKSKLLVLDTNPKEEAIIYFAKLANGIPIFADPVSTAKANRLLPILDKIYLLKPNRYELSSLTNLPCETKEEIEEAVSVLLSKGVYSVIVSMGEDGVYYANKDGEHFYESIAPSKEMKNATGAGDAFLAGAIHAYLKGYTPKEMVRFALGAGKLTVASNETINKEMNEENVLAIIK